MSTHHPSSPKPTHELQDDTHLEESFPAHQYSDVVTLLSWEAPGRPFQKRSREYFMNILVIALLVSIILFLFSQYLLMVVVAALVFLSFALSSTPPRNFHYKITSEGLQVEDYFFLWEELYDFRFKKQHGQDVLIVSTKAYVPGELLITLGEMHADHVKSILLGFLPFRQYVKPDFMEKAGDWLEKNFPLEGKSPVKK